MDDFGDDIMLPWSADTWRKNYKIIEPFNYGSMVYFLAPWALIDIVWY